MEFILNVLGGIGFNWHVALVNFVNFLILLFILNKFVFGKVLKNIDSRNSLIKKGLDDAEKAEKLLTSSKLQSEDLVMDARKKSEQIISESVLKAESLSKDIVAKSEKEISDLKNKLKSDISSAKENAEKDLLKNAPDLILNMMSKSFSENMDKETHDKLLGMLVK